MTEGMRLHSPDFYMSGEVGFPFRQLERVYNQLIEEDDGLIFEAESMDIMDAAYNPGEIVENRMILDAVSTRYNKFPRTMAALHRVFNRQLPDSIEAMEPEIGEPRKAGGFATVTAQFPFNDGQRVTIIFHAPGSGSAIRGSDEVVAFRWLLNKRDITHIVAPEMTKGVMRDIPLQQLARRISQLVEKNSSRFRAKQEKVQKARTALMETEQLVEQLDQQFNALQLELQHMGDDSPDKVEKISQLQTELDSWNKRNTALSGLLTPRSNKTRTIRAHDMELETTMEVISVDELITSDDERFDQRLQPRDRTREASKEQIRGMVRTLDPYQLMDAPTADTGAPVVGPDGMVESGNGRTMALRQVVKDPLLHRRYAQAVEQQTGIKIREGEVLIRRRTTPMNLEQRMQFTKAANQQNIAKMSSTEQGLSDARMIDDGMLSEFKGGELTSVANTGFVSAFIGKLPVNERNDLIGAHGQLSQTGVIRIRNALLGSAYESADVMTRVTESTDDNVKSISNALVDAAPAIARLKRDVEAGRVEPEFDISKQIAEAAGKVSQARANRQAIGEVLNQNDMFGERDLITEELIKAFYNHDMSRALGRDKIAQSLIHYATQARHETTDGNLFGASISPAELLADANKRRDDGSTGQGSIFDSLTRVFMNPLFDGMVIKDTGPDMPFTGLELDAAMVSLYARDGYGLMTEAHSLQIMDAAYNPGTEVESMVLDAVSGDASKLPRIMGVMARSMSKKLTGGLYEVGHILGKPKVSGGFATVTAQIQISDGQTVSVIFHAPDNDPKRIAPSDQVIAFRFLLNSRDITHVVAPEMVKQGIMRDIPLATVTKRISQLVQKNSARFTTQQEKNQSLKSDLAKAEAEVLALTERSVTLADDIAQLEQLAPMEQELTRIEAENDALRKQIEELKSKQEPDAPSESLPPWQMAREDWAMQQVMAGEYAEEYLQDEYMLKGQLDHYYKEWTRGLEARAKEGRISTNAIDDYVSLFGIEALRSRFRGSLEPGIEGYESTDTRLWDKTYKQVQAMKKAGSLGIMVKGGTSMKDLHRADIKKALEAGEAVPEKVLKEYPELARQAEPEGPSVEADVSKFINAISRIKENSDSDFQRKTIEGITARVNKFESEGIEYPTPERYMQDVNDGRRVGFSEQKQRDELEESNKTLSGLKSGTVKPRSVIGTGGTKKLAIEYIENKIRELEHSLAHGGILYSANLSNYAYTLRDVEGGKDAVISDEQIAAKEQERKERDAELEQEAERLKELASRSYEVGEFKDMTSPLWFHFNVTTRFSDHLLASVAEAETLEEKYNLLKNSSLAKQKEMSFRDKVDFNTARKKGAEFGYFSIEPRKGYKQVKMAIDLRATQKPETEGPSPEITEAVETLRKAAAGDFGTFAATMDAAEKAIDTLDAAGLAEQYDDLIGQATDKAFEMDTAENGA